MKPDELTPMTGVALKNGEPAVVLTPPDERGFLTVAIATHKNDVMTFPENGDAVVLTMLPDGLDEIAKARNRSLDLKLALVRLSRTADDGACWCEVAHSKLTIHSVACDAARAALASP